MIIFSISTTKHGSMSLTGHPELDFENILNRTKFLMELGIHSDQLISSSLVHGSRVEAVSKRFAGTKLSDDIDGLITGDKGIFLSVLAADCFPVMFHDPINEVVGIAHCGWRGISRGIIENMISKMETEFGCEPKNIIVNVGPGIKGCHFEVRSDVRNIFVKDCPKFIDKLFNFKDKWKINLELIIEEKLMSEGIIGSHINWKDCVCTYCSLNYFSFRRDGFDPQGRLRTQMAVIGMPEIIKEGVIAYNSSTLKINANVA